MIHHGDCVEVMAGMEPESVDAICTDPPYGLEFMGKQWDRLATVEESSDTKGWRAGHGGRGLPSPTDGTPFGGSGQRVRYGKAGMAAQEWHHRWALEAFRVAKPGAYLLAFGGTRTFHRLAVAIEDAGWIIRDTLVWAYLSGFPKGRANLKPAWEPIVMARKPGPLRPLAIDECRIAAPENVGVTWTRGGKQQGASLRTNTSGENEYVESHPAGRWPANVVLTDAIFDGGVDGVVGGSSAIMEPCQSSTAQPVDATSTTDGSASTAHDSAEPMPDEPRTPARSAGPLSANRVRRPAPNVAPIWPDGAPGSTGIDSIPTGLPELEPEPSGSESAIASEPSPDPRSHSVQPAKNAELPNTSTDTTTTTRSRLRSAPSAPVATTESTPELTGGYSRFFLLPKADRNDREPIIGRDGKTRRNTHPTVKSTELMRHLVRLVTPPGGVVLDPFLGSGSTAIAAEKEGFQWIGIEKEAEYVAIAEARLNGVQRGLGLDVPAPTRKRSGGPVPIEKWPANDGVPGYKGQWRKPEEAA